ncbi:MAG: Tol-Pal system beta propeller repeat protein TolB [Candidatus Handelsmanbacteria bacterium RIFCSPLOWO2_12_FULL_64_10]|uniref:Tol-Pal system beta propeller repeat protein TolB n=1 Tax=Handelsmanbacteria sp. (strain RIFCSPLOWO2_12_FULL_64_10) TaxID=1817868 RepID=A0A1F6CSX7_HANXR|nr:MAG: Tol-Pal system beta propeller repeat protein TolB [Candidatus Handelsmanbacteria bacterium RIFCSPLOWO2_12_FULL_64_10]
MKRASDFGLWTSDIFRYIGLILLLSAVCLSPGDEAFAQPAPAPARPDTGVAPVVHLGVKGSRRSVISLALTPFSRDTSDAALNQIAEAIFAVLSEDLRNSARFEVLADSARADTTGQGTLLDRWSAAGARALVRGLVRQKPDGLELYATLYRLPDGKLLIGKAYRVDRERVRGVAHRLSDDIVYSLTGQQGVASSQIAFVSAVRGHKELYLMGYDGHGLRPLTDDRTINRSPAWSPDGRRIVYSSLRQQRWDLFIVDALSGAATPVRTSSTFNTSPAWSPDGRQILFSINDESNIDLYTISVSGWRPRRGTDHPEGDTEPSWSPDGQKVAFTSDRAGTPQVYIMNADGSNIRRLTWEPDAYEGSPRWSPDGRRITFVRRGFDGFDVHVMEVEGGTPFRLTAGGSNENPSWSPDGLQITFCSNRDGGDDIYVMNWDGTNLRRLTSGGGNSSPAWSPAPRQEGGD